MGNYQQTQVEPKNIEPFPFLKNFYRRRSYEFWKMRVPDGFRKLGDSHPYPLSYIDPLKIEESLGKIIREIKKNNDTSGSVNGIMVSLGEWIFESCKKKNERENVDHIVNALIILRFILHDLISKSEDFDELNRYFKRFPQNMEEHLPGNIIDYFLSSLVTYISEKELNQKTYFVHYEILNLLIVMFSTTFYLGIEFEESSSSESSSSSEEESSSTEEEEEGESSDEEEEEDVEKVIEEEEEKPKKSAISPSAPTSLFDGDEENTSGTSAAGFSPPVSVQEEKGEEKKPTPTPQVEELKEDTELIEEDRTPQIEIQPEEKKEGEEEVEEAEEEKVIDLPQQQQQEPIKEEEEEEVKPEEEKEEEERVKEEEVEKESTQEEEDEEIDDGEVHDEEEILDDGEMDEEEEEEEEPIQDLPPVEEDLQPAEEEQQEPKKVEEKEEEKKVVEEIDDGEVEDEVEILDDGEDDEEEEILDDGEMDEEEEEEPIKDLPPVEEDLKEQQIEPKKVEEKEGEEEEEKKPMEEEEEKESITQQGEEESDEEEEILDDGEMDEEEEILDDGEIDDGEVKPEEEEEEEPIQDLPLVEEDLQPLRMEEETQQQQPEEKDVKSTTTTPPEELEEGGEEIGTKKEEKKVDKESSEEGSSATSSSSEEEEDSSEEEEEEEGAEEGEGESSEDEDEEDSREHNIFLESLMRIRAEEFVSTFIYNLLSNIAYVSPTSSQATHISQIFHDPLSPEIPLTSSFYHPKQQSESSERRGGGGGVFTMVSDFLWSIPTFAYGIVFGEEIHDDKEAYAKLFASRKRYILAQVSANVLQFLLFYRKTPRTTIISTGQKKEEEEEHEGEGEEQQNKDDDNEEEEDNIFLKTFRSMKNMPYDIMTSLLVAGLASPNRSALGGRPGSPTRTTTTNISSVSLTTGLGNNAGTGTDEESLYIMMYLLLTENEEFIKFVLNHPRPTNYLLPVLKKLYLDTTRKTENQITLKKQIKKSESVLNKTLEIRSNDQGRAKWMIEQSNKKLTPEKEKSSTKNITPSKKKDDDDEQNINPIGIVEPVQQQQIQHHQQQQPQPHKHPEYTKEYVWLQIIILMILSQHGPFCRGLDRPLTLEQARGMGKWYKEYKFSSGQVNGNSALFMVVIRNIHWSVGKKKEYNNDLNVNALCVCANIAPTATDLHAHAAERLFKLMRLLCRKLQQYQTQKMERLEEKLGQDSSTSSSSSITNELEQKCQNLSSLLHICVEIVNSVLFYGFNRNLSFCYQFLWEGETLKTTLREIEDQILISSNPDTLKLELSNIQTCLSSLEDFMNPGSNYASTPKTSWTVSEVQYLLQQASNSWKKDKLGMKKSLQQQQQPKATKKATTTVLKYRFHEEDTVEGFFFPYIWSMVLIHTDVVDWKLEKVQFDLPFLGLGDQYLSELKGQRNHMIGEPVEDSSSNAVDPSSSTTTTSENDDASNEDSSSSSSSLDDGKTRKKSSSTSATTTTRNQGIVSKEIQEEDADQAMDFLGSTTTDEEERRSRRKFRRLRRKKVGGGDSSNNKKKPKKKGHHQVGSPLVEKNELVGDAADQKKDEVHMQV